MSKWGSVDKMDILITVLCLALFISVFFIKGYEGDKPTAPIQVEVR
jgi:hypothetical protein